MINVLYILQNILINNDFSFIKNWIDNLCISPNAHRLRLNRTLFREKSFKGLLNGV